MRIAPAGQDRFSGGINNGEVAPVGQVASGLGEWWRQLSSGNAYVAGETAFNLASLVIGAGEVQTAFKVARGGEATSLLSKSGIFVKTLGKSGAKNVQRSEEHTSELQSP